MSAIERYVPEDGEIDRIQRIAENFANSGYFADASAALQAFVKISAGAEMGLQPFVSMSGIAIIKGKPVVGAGILAGLLDAHPDFDYSVTWAPNSTEPTSCTVTVFKNGKERGESTFSMDDARKANLAGKDVWKSYSRNMLYARAMSNAVAWYAPSVTRSNGRLYVEGEIEDETPAPASRRKREAPAAPVAPPEETVIEAEVVPADPVVRAAAEDNPEASVESKPSAGTTTIAEQTEACKLVVKAMTKKQLDVVKEACEFLGIPWDAATPFGLVKRFGSDATDRDSLLRVLVAAVTPPALVEGEVPFGEDGADRFQAHLDQDAEKNAADAKADAAIKSVLERHEAMAAAGSYGES